MLDYPPLPLPEAHCRTGRRKNKQHGPLIIIKSQNPVSTMPCLV